MSRIFRYQTMLKLCTNWQSRFAHRGVHRTLTDDCRFSNAEQFRMETETEWPRGDLYQKIRGKVPSKIGTRMLDDGLLDVIRDTPREDIPSVIKGIMRKYSKPRDLHEVKTCYSLISKLRDILPKSCETCLFPKPRCVCYHIKTVEPKHKLWVFQNTGDYGRKNNSATLLCVVAGAQRTLRGFQEQEDELSRHIAENKKSTIIVFPSEVATEVEDFATQITAVANDEPQTLILLDGTWGDAANMDKFLPKDVTRVKLSAEKRTTWLYPMRGQSRYDRVCTAQAAALVLKCLGDNGAHDAIKFAVESAVRLTMEDRQRKLGGST